MLKRQCLLHDPQSSQADNEESYVAPKHTILIHNINIIPWVSKDWWPFYNAKVIDLTSMSPLGLIFNITQMSKFKVCSETQGNLLPVRPKNKICFSNIKWHGVHTAIPKGKNRSTAWKCWTKPRPKPIRANSKPTSSTWGSRWHHLCSWEVPAFQLCCWISICDLFLWPTPFCAHSFPSKIHLMFLASPAPWVSTTILFHFPGLMYRPVSGVLCRKSNHAAWGLASAAFWSLVEKLHGPLISVSCMLSTAAPYEWYCQLLLPAKHVIWTASATARVADMPLSGWA